MIGNTILNSDESVDGPAVSQTQKFLERDDIDVQIPQNVSKYFSYFQ